MNTEVQAALAELGVAGSFAVRRQEPADALVLEVDGVGAIRFPVTSTTARALIAVAVRSPYGWKDKTIVDPKVRDGWELPKSKVRIDGRRWNPHLRVQLEAMKAKLGLSGSGTLTATLDKLTIYGPGQFFTVHRDTEKSDTMIGTLVVVLPSHGTGGAIRIEHQGKRVEYRRTARAAKQLELIAFYADCHHEVRPVESGHRLALVYQLHWQPGAEDGASEVPERLAGRFEAVREAIEEHFATPQTRRFALDPNDATRPEKLVYLLDHQYTQRNLGWDRLKHADALRAQALRHAAERLDLEVHLALADVHEVWQCEAEYEGGNGRGWYGRYEDDDDDDDHADEDDYTLVDLIESSVALAHWKDASGRAVSHAGVRVDDREVCLTTPSDALRPFDSNYEGYMGNYGDTLDRWYHRAAIVLWPRARSFIVEAKASPEATMKRLTAELRRAGPGRPQALARARMLLEVWPDLRRELEQASGLPSVLRLAHAVHDAALARMLLAPLRPETVPAAASAPLRALLERYGEPWCRGVVMAWREPVVKGGRRITAWAAFSPACLRGFVAGGPGGVALAGWIVEGQWRELQEVVGAMKARGKRYDRDAYREHAPEVSTGALAVLQGCVLAEMHETHAAVLARLVGEGSPLSLLERADLVLAAAGELGPKQRREWQVDRWLRDVEQAMLAALAEPSRGEGDWSIRTTRTCKCKDCGELHAFLESERVSLGWPLAKDRRQHIHGVIDGLELPVTHVTRRVGRPFTLVLTKTEALLRREGKWRGRCERRVAGVRGALGTGRAGKTGRR